MNNHVITAVKQLASPILRAEGLSLVDIEFKKEGRGWILRVFIDRESGFVDLEDCSRVSKKLSEKLDEVDLITDTYYLDLSSPGVERTLKRKEDFQKAINKQVHITTYEPVYERKDFTGILVEFTDEHYVVEEMKNLWKIPREKVAKTRLAVFL